MPSTRESSRTGLPGQKKDRGTGRNAPGPVVFRMEPAADGYYAASGKEKPIGNANVRPAKDLNFSPVEWLEGPGYTVKSLKKQPPPPPAVEEEAISDEEEIGAEKSAEQSAPAQSGVVGEDAMAADSPRRPMSREGLFFNFPMPALRSSSEARTMPPSWRWIGKGPTHLGYTEGWPERAGWREESGYSQDDSD